MPHEIGRAPFVTKEDNYGNKSTVTLVFMDDGTVRWERPPVREEWEEFQLPIESIFPRENESSGGGRV